MAIPSSSSLNRGRGQVWGLVFDMDANSNKPPAVDRPLAQFGNLQGTLRSPVIIFDQLCVALASEVIEVDHDFRVMKMMHADQVSLERSHNVHIRKQGSLPSK